MSFYKYFKNIITFTLCCLFKHKYDVCFLNVCFVNLCMCIISVPWRLKKNEIGPNFDGVVLYVSWFSKLVSWVWYKKMSTLKQQWSLCIAQLLLILGKEILWQMYKISRSFIIYAFCVCYTVLKGMRVGWLMHSSGWEHGKEG
jgi:hypothetical protein